MKSSVDRVAATELEQRPQQEAPDPDDRRHRDQSRGEGKKRRGLRGRVGQHRDHEQQRRHQQVLEQQDGKDRAAGEGVEAPLFRQHRHDDRGRGQGERGAGHDRRRLGEAIASAR